MVDSFIPWIKKVIRSMNYQEAQKLVETLLEGEDGEENEKILSLWIQEKFPDMTQKVLCAY
jgi:hypothetical protein